MLNDLGVAVYEQTPDAENAAAEQHWRPPQPRKKKPKKKPKLPCPP
jgi:hypothetical protein